MTKNQINLVVDHYRIYHPLTRTGDKEARALEDADCLVFLETKLQDYMDAWEESKALRILQGTFGKMTPDGRARALQLKLGDRERELVRRAGLSANAGSHSG